MSNDIEASKDLGRERPNDQQVGDLTGAKVIVLAPRRAERRDQKAPPTRNSEDDNDPNPGPNAA